MKVSWPRQANDQLRMPPVCVVTGEPATTQLPVVFRNRTSIWLPAIGRLVMSLTNPPAVVTLPLTDAARSKINSWRLIALGGAVGGIVLAAVSAAVIKNLAGSLLAFVFFAAAIGLLIFGRLRSNTMGADVNGDVISMDQAHPTFIQALVAANQPGMVNVIWTSGPVPVNAPVPQTYSQQTYPQQTYSQQPYPQNGYPQGGQRGYALQPYQQQGSPQGVGPQSGQQQGYPPQGYGVPNYGQASQPGPGFPQQNQQTYPQA